MNRHTALRTFGAPGYTPTRHVRVFNTRWYLVTLQDFHSDIGGGLYLDNTEHTYLMTGTKAREERNKHLNRCNAITQYNGPVIQITAIVNGKPDEYYSTQAGGPFVTDETAVVVARARLHALEQQWLTETTAEADRYAHRAVHGPHHRPADAEMYAEWAEETRKLIASHIPWTLRADRIR